jgi:hypothetical protein
MAKPTGNDRWRKSRGDPGRRAAISIAILDDRIVGVVLFNVIWWALDAAHSGRIRGRRDPVGTRRYIGMNVSCARTCAPPRLHAPD